MARYQIYRKLIVFLFVSSWHMIARQQPLPTKMNGGPKLSTSRLELRTLAIAHYAYLRKCTWWSFAQPRTKGRPLAKRGDWENDHMSPNGTLQATKPLSWAIGQLEFVANQGGLRITATVQALHHGEWQVVFQTRGLVFFLGVGWSNWLGEATTKQMKQIKNIYFGCEYFSVCSSFQGMLETPLDAWSPEWGSVYGQSQSWWPSESFRKAEAKSKMTTFEVWLDSLDVNHSKLQSFCEFALNMCTAWVYAGTLHTRRPKPMRSEDPWFTGSSWPHVQIFPRKCRFFKTFLDLVCCLRFFKTLQLQHFYTRKSPRAMKPGRQCRARSACSGARSGGCSQESEPRWLARWGMA